MKPVQKAGACRIHIKCHRMVCTDLRLHFAGRTRCIRISGNRGHNDKLYLGCILKAIASLHGEGVSGIRLEINKKGELLNATIGGKPVVDDQLYTVATIDYLADGNGRMDAFLQAEKRECPEDATLRGLFLDYVRKQTAEGKIITSKLDGRITVK